MKICILILWIEFGTRPKTQVSPDCDLSNKSRSRVPCTEGGPGQSQANVPTNHENAWALDLCFGILPRGTAKKLLKSLVAPSLFQASAESKGNESITIHFRLIFFNKIEPSLMHAACALHGELQLAGWRRRHFEGPGPGPRGAAAPADYSFSYNFSR